MSVIQWSYPSFSIRAKSSSGAVLLTWIPETSLLSSVRTMPVRIGPPAPVRDVLDRMLLSQERRPWVRGYRVALPVVWIVRSYYILGLSGTGRGPLHNVLELEQGGGYLEVTLNGTTWRRVDILRMLQTNLDGKNVGIRLEIDFVQTALRTTMPSASDGDW